MDIGAFYDELLRDQGFRPGRSSLGNVSFRFEGHAYVVVLYPDDPAFLHLLCPGVWTITSTEELVDALQIGAEITGNTKVAKVFVESDRSRVSASAELYLPSLSVAGEVFPRALRTVQSAALELRQRMRRGANERSAAQLRALVLRRLNEVLCEGYLDGAGVLFTDDYLCSDPACPPDGWPLGPEGAAALVETYHGAFERLSLHVHEHVVAGGTVTTRWSLSATHVGPFKGLPPSGRPVQLDAISLDEVRGGRICRTVTTYDCTSLLAHLRLVPLPAQGEER